MSKPVAGSQFLGGALQKECNRGAAMILTRPPSPPPVDNFLGKKIFPTSTLQLLSRYFISIFHTKFRYLVPPCKTSAGAKPPGVRFLEGLKLQIPPPPYSMPMRLFILGHKQSIFIQKLSMTLKY